MTGQRCILACGRDARLLETRRLLLESDGYRVVTAAGPTSAIEILLSEPIELAVLCHTFSEQECLAILAALHTYHPEAKVVALQADKAPCKSGDDTQAINIFEGPQKFLSKVHELVDVTIRPEKQSTPRLTPQSAYSSH